MVQKNARHTIKYFNATHLSSGRERRIVKVAMIMIVGI